MEFTAFDKNNSATYPPINTKVLVLYKSSGGTLIYGIDMMTQLFTTMPKFSNPQLGTILGWWILPPMPDNILENLNQI